VRRLAVLRRPAVLGLVCAAALLADAGMAWAHVAAEPPSATQGSYAVVSFRTPNEEDTATTVRLQVTLPADHPIASVAVEPGPGWTATTDKTTLAHPLRTDDGAVSQAVSTITWSGGQIAPDQFQELRVSLGPLPRDTDRLVFKAVQTYSNGDVARWIDVPGPADPEPEHPAPVLRLTPATDGPATGLAGPARWLGVAGVVLGLAGVLLGGLALRRRSG
jgi:uncharacterized protein YcnI